MGQGSWHGMRKVGRRAFLGLCIVLCLPLAARAALIPPFFINSVVGLGSMQIVSRPGETPRLEWVTEGTGFFYGYLLEDNDDKVKRKYEIFIVTARHVVEQHMQSQRADLSVRVNPKEAGSPVQEFTLPSQSATGSGTWFYHPNEHIDLAAIRVNFAGLREHGFEPDFFANDQHAARINKLADLEVAAGDGVFVLGFPMNLSSGQRDYVIVRQGSIARISEMLDNASDSFLIDAFVFPGNSGSPVALKPEFTSIANTKSQTTAYLIGVVTAYRPYTDVAISAQTKQPRIIFQENSGLAEVLPTDFIDEAIEAWHERQKPDKKP